MATASIATASSVLEFPAVSAGQITQSELAEIIVARRAAAKLEKHVASLESAMLVRLHGGAAIEDGQRTAEIKVSERRNVSWKDVVVRLKGEGYVGNVLAHTKPSTSESLRIS